MCTHDSQNGSPAAISLPRIRRKIASDSSYVRLQIVFGTTRRFGPLTNQVTMYRRRELSLITHYGVEKKTLTKPVIFYLMVLGATLDF